MRDPTAPLADPTPTSAAELRRVFLITWLGQLISVVGSGLTSFLIGLHVYQVTGSITQLSLVSFLYVFPAMLLSPIAGALVDRWDRRRAMLISDVGAGLGTVALWALLAGGRTGLFPLQTWHLLLPIAQISAFSTLRWPAYAATIALLVPKRDLGRANGMVELAGGAGQVAAPLLAATLVKRIGLERVILIDLASFVFAVSCLTVLRFPRPPAEAGAARPSITGELARGFRFIRERSGLVGLVLLSSGLNVVMAFVWVLITPLVLSIADVSVLGMTFSIAGLGMLLGGITSSVWRGPRRRMSTVLGFLLLAGGVLLLGALPPSIALLTTACAAFLFCVPLIQASAGAIWQLKVPPALQGRVFATRRMIVLAVSAFANLAAGPVADHFFEPWLAPGGWLAGSVGLIVGTGRGRGIGFLFTTLGVLVIAGVITSRLTPRLWDVEHDLPDALPHDDAKGPSTEVSAS